MMWLRLVSRAAPRSAKIFSIATGSRSVTETCSGFVFCLVRFAFMSRCFFRQKTPKLYTVQDLFWFFLFKTVFNQC